MSPVVLRSGVVVCGLLGIALGVFSGCQMSPAPKPPEPEPTEMELKIRMIETSRQVVTQGTTTQDRAVAEVGLEYWMRSFDEQTGKVTEPVVAYPHELRTAEDHVRQAYWVWMRGMEAYEELMLTDPTFGPSPEARKGIARRRGDAERIVENFRRSPEGVKVSAEVREWQTEILRKRNALLKAGPAAWQKPLLEEMVRWWNEFGRKAGSP